MVKTRTVLFVVMLLGLNFTRCTVNNTIIPSGVYELMENKKKSEAGDCKVIKDALGHTLIVDNDSILTSVMHESKFEKYAVMNVKENVYEINVNHSSVTPVLATFLYEPVDNHLEFCSGKMMYKKIK
jgi:hypothetical protein